VEIWGLAEWEFEVDQDLLLAVGEELAMFEEARHEECWRNAMIEEMASIE
jgi:hypothetical protein